MPGFEIHDRVYIRARIHEELARGKRHRHPFALLIFELLPSSDGLPPLRKMTAGLQVLNASIREGDCVGKAFDDTIVVLLTQTDVRGARDTLMRLRNRIMRTAGSWHVTVYTFPADEEAIAAMPLLTAA